ncbi:hypothetical protein ACKF11_13765 [Methylobacillus sp. Pita2]|uniref:hypothetical protein n=1 Tax=Methylobacillus sp. Pita2 TaxID=3383245 RepID=UPI0038B4F2F8
MSSIVSKVFGGWARRSRVSTGIFDKNIRVLSGDKFVSVRKDGLVAEVTGNTVKLISGSLVHEFQLNSTGSAQRLGRMLFKAMRPFYYRLIKLGIALAVASMVISAFKTPVSDNIDFITPAVSSDQEIADVMRLIERAKQDQAGNAPIGAPHDQEHGHADAAELPPIPFSE